MSEQDDAEAAACGGALRGRRAITLARRGPGKTEVTSNTPENAQGKINPSAPEDSNTTPGSTAKDVS